MGRDVNRSLIQLPGQSRFTYKDRPAHSELYRCEPWKTLKTVTVQHLWASCFLACLSSKWSFSIDKAEPFSVQFLFVSPTSHHHSVKGLLHLLYCRHWQAAGSLPLWSLFWPSPDITLSPPSDPPGKPQLNLLWLISLSYILGVQNWWQYSRHGLTQVDATTLQSWAC